VLGRNGLMGVAVKALLASGVALACLAATAAFAQPEERLRQGVLDRDRPAYAARGIRVGTVLLYPALDISAAYDDNIYATKNNAKSDVVFQTRPELKVESNLPRHAFWLRGDVLNGTYIDHAKENRTDYYIGGGTRIDIQRTTNWNTNIEYQKDTEDRGSPDADGAAVEPVNFRRFQADSALRYRPGRFNIEAGGIFENYNFDNVALIGGGFQNNKDRNRDVAAGYGRLGYDISPGYELFALGMYSITNYAQHFDDDGFDRDSHGYQAEAGARFEVTNVISGEASVGYLSRDFFDGRLPGVSGVSTEAKANWYLTRLTTLNFTASRRAQETTLFGAAGYIDSVFGAGVDHELRRNLILSADLRYDNRDYVGVVRTDDQYEARMRALYLLNRNYSVAGEYHFYDRNSSVGSEDFIRNTFMVTFRAQI
jgi:hypothetical protein